MNNTRDSSSDWIMMAAVALTIVGYLIYLTLRNWSASIGINVPALLALIFGIVVDAAVIAACWLQGWNRARILPWLIPFSLFCLFPSLTCWAATDDPLALRHLSYTPDADEFTSLKWFGQWGWQFLAFCAACLGSFFLMKHLDDDYGW